MIQDPNDPDLFHPSKKLARQGVQSKRRMESTYGTVYVDAGFPEHLKPNPPDPKIIPRIASKIKDITTTDIKHVQAQSQNPALLPRWPWIGAVNKTTGVPIISYDGRPNDVRPLLFSLCFGPIPFGYRLQRIDQAAGDKLDVDPRKRRPVPIERFSETPKTHVPQTELTTYDEQTIQDLLTIINDEEITTVNEFWSILGPDLFDATEADINTILERAGITQSS